MSKLDYKLLKHVSSTPTIRPNTAYFTTGRNEIVISLPAGDSFEVGEKFFIEALTAGWVINNSENNILYWKKNPTFIDTEDYALMQALPISLDYLSSKKEGDFIEFMRCDISIGDWIIIDCSEGILELKEEVNE